VDSVLKKPSAVSLKKGDNITVEVKDPSAFQQGAQATFYAEGWIFGSGVAVKELGHDFNLGGGTPAEKVRTSEAALGQMQKQISDQDLQKPPWRRRTWLSSDALRMSTAGPSPNPPPRVIPSPNTARTGMKPFLQIKTILKGTKPKGGKMAVRFSALQRRSLD